MYAQLQETQEKKQKCKEHLHNERKGGTIQKMHKLNRFQLLAQRLVLNTCRMTSFFSFVADIWEKEEHVILISITTHTVGDHGAICCSLRKSLLNFFLKKADLPLIGVPLFYTCTIRESKLPVYPLESLVPSQRFS